MKTPSRMQHLQGDAYIEGFAGVGGSPPVASDSEEAT